MKVLPFGDAALLAEVDELDEVLALAAAVRAAQPTGCSTWCRPRGRCCSRWRRARTSPPCGGHVCDLPVDPAAAPEGETVEIAVTYDGPDLAEVARLTGLDEDEVVAAHTGTPWRIAFGGFAPGFAYLTGGDERLRVPRRDEPRTTVPAGAVGLAGEFSGVYPRSSPGGWQLIGSTDALLWDPERDPPALLASGRHGAVPGGVVIVDCGMLSSWSFRCEWSSRVSRALEVVAVGALALVQDLGRPGHGASGVGRSGAADRAALRLANRLVANAEGAAGLEVVFGGLAVRATAPLTVALAGAAAPGDVDGTPVGHHALVDLRPGQVLRLGMPPTGLRTYLAVRGGVDVPPVLGSRSTDTLSGLGPPKLEGDVLPVGPEPAALPLVDVAPVCPRRATPSCCGPCSGRARSSSPSRRSCPGSRGRRRAGATGSACGWRAGGCGGLTTRRCPARAWCAVRSRCRRVGSPSSSWPIIL